MKLEGINTTNETYIRTLEESFLRLLNSVKKYKSTPDEAGYKEYMFDYTIANAELVADKITERQAEEIIDSQLGCDLNLLDEEPVLDCKQ